MWLLVAGLYGVATSRHLVHLVTCLSVVQSSTYVLLLAVGFRHGGEAPLLSDGVTPASRVADSVVQALALTDVVVGATTFALLLALAVLTYKRHGTADPERLTSLVRG